MRNWGKVKEPILAAFVFLASSSRAWVLSKRQAVKLVRVLRTDHESSRSCCIVTHGLCKSFQMEIQMMF
jgi:hypothetical protein